MTQSLCYLLILTSISCYAQRDSLQYYLTKAKEAKTLQNNEAYYKSILKAHQIHPYHPSILYQCAVASSLINKKEEAISFLRKAIYQNTNYDLNIPEFSNLQNDHAYLELKSLKETLAKKIIQSDTAFIIKDRSLHVECITADETSNTFYFGSIHKRKIISMKDGKITDFISAAQDSITSVFGIKVDRKRNLLWACASPMKEMENYDSTLKSAVYKFNLQTGKLIDKYSPSQGSHHVFGDLVLDPVGNAYISDGTNNIIFKVDQKQKKLVAFYQNDEFWNLQGIVFDQDGKNLFIADYIKGLYKLEMKTKNLTKLEPLFDISLKSIDGLCYYNNSLIAIQNAINPMRVTQYLMDKDKNKLTSYHILDNAHPAFNEPTIGCIANKSFYYVANSLWSGYDAQKRIKPDSSLQDVIILKVKPQN